MPNKNLKLCRIKIKNYADYACKCGKNVIIYLKYLYNNKTLK